MRAHRPLARPALAALAFLLAAAPLRLAAQGGDDAKSAVSKETRQRAHRMLAQVRDDVRKYYYDSTFHGLDLNARFTEASARLDQAPTNNHLWAGIAQFLAELNDSHTSFYPPSRVAQVEYGVSMQFLGDTCYVVGVKRGSDADKKGVRVGDVVLGIDAYKPHRSSFWTMQYVYNTLSPRPGLHLSLRAPDGTMRELDAMAKIEMGERIVDLDNPATVSRLINEYEAAVRIPTHYYQSLGDDVLLWKMPNFIYGDERGIDEMMGRAKKHRAVILDLRNNPGGAVRTLQYFVGGFFDREVEIGTEVTRAGRERLATKVRDRDPYRGLLVILVNSGSASAAEITARALQLEGRAIVVGDRTMGAVVVSRYYGHEVGFGRRVPYGASITVSDLVMSDGQRLEGVGVAPDHVVLPDGAALASRHDPQMAKALELVGVTMDAEAAGQLLRARAR